MVANGRSTADAADDLFAFAATARVVEHHHFDALFDAYLRDDDLFILHSLNEDNIAMTCPMLSARAITSTAVFLGVLASPLTVIADEGMVAISGWGSESCGKWLEVRRAGYGADMSLRQWALGYLSAYNTFISRDGDALDGADDAALMVLVDEECREDPVQLITTEVATVIRMRDEGRPALLDSDPLQ